MSSSPDLIRGNVAQDYPDYLRDESRRVGRADSISFPRSEEELRQVLAETSAQEISVTIQGARTGITAGAVPDGGHILNLSRMSQITGFRHDPASNLFFVRVQPGVALADLNAGLAKKELDASFWTANSREALERFKEAGPFFFPPDPTETTASLGGIVSCNASGACTFGYGPTRPYVEALRVVLADGAVLDLRRGRQKATSRRFSIATAGHRWEGRLPAYAMPVVKNAAGYFVEDDMDLLDLFVGSEGTLGVVSEMELRLLPAPPAKWGVTAFFGEEKPAVRFVRGVRGEPLEGCATVVAHKPCAIEFFDGRALQLLRERKQSSPAFAEIPDVAPEFRAAVYVEYHGGSEDETGGAVAVMSEIMTACGGREDATWIATSDREMEPLRKFRHAVPEAVNLTIDERRKTEPRLVKLGTDMAAPDAALETVIALYHRDLAAAELEYVMFGHIGNNHLHVNILPRNIGEYDAGRKLYVEWARKIIAMGGTVAAEHGIGKLKTALLREMYGEAGIEQMRAVRRVFDPDALLNPGNLF